MKSGEQGSLNPHKDPAFIDYSVVYKQKEIKQLQKRLRKTRNILLIAALAFLLGGMLFMLIPEADFTGKNMMYYIFMSVLLAIFGLLSRKRPYGFILLALMVCIAYWGFEILLGNMENLLIEGTIHKLCIISLLISGLHTSREAELIRKELHFS